MGEIVAHPRLLEHQGERQRRRRRIAIFASVLVVVLVGAVVVQSPLAGVRHLHIHGADRTGAEAVAAASGLGPRSAIARLDGARVSRRVAALPWVESATVVREWPSTVRLTVVERTPAATVGCVGTAAGECPVLVDRAGRVLAPASELTERADLPVIEGLPPAGAPGTSLPEDAQGALAVAALLPPSLRPMVAAVVAGADGEVVLRLQTVGSARPGGRVVLGSPDRVAAKLTAAATVLAHLAAQNNGKLSPSSSPPVLDVRVPEAPALETKLDR